MKRTFTSLLVAMFIWVFILPHDVSAKEILFGPGATFQIGNTIIVDAEHNSLPYNGVVYANGSLNLGALQVQYSGNSVGNPYDSPEYNYLYLNICASTNYSYLTMNITNSSTIHSYFVTGAYKGTDVGTTCATQGYNGHNYLFQIPVGKWEYGEYSEWFEVASYNSFTSTNGVYFTINRVWLANEDILADYNSQQALQNKLNSINTAITNMQNNITTNNNTNTQNIINNQNQNAQQAHNDATTTQNKIDGVKDAVNDDNVNSNTGKSFFDNFSDNTHGLSGIITAPLNMINGLVNVSSTSCSDLTGTYQNQNFSIPCGKLLWGHTGISQFNDFYNLVVGGALCYWIIRDLFLTIEALKDPDNDKVEVMSL